MIPATLGPCLGTVALGRNESSVSSQLPTIPCVRHCQHSFPRYPSLSLLIFAHGEAEARAAARPHLASVCRMLWQQPWLMRYDSVFLEGLELQRHMHMKLTCAQIGTAASDFSRRNGLEERTVWRILPPLSPPTGVSTCPINCGEHGAHLQFHDNSGRRGTV